jgi:hypothetical protein
MSPNPTHINLSDDEIHRSRPEKKFQNAYFSKIKISKLDFRVNTIFDSRSPLDSMDTTPHEQRKERK